MRPPTARYPVHMAEQTYKDPNISLNRIYTKGGDKGQTSLVNGRRLAKDELKIASYGVVDELGAFVGTARISAIEAGLSTFAASLLRVQHELFNLGSILATDPAEVKPGRPRVAQADIEQLETEIDACLEGLPKLNSFTLAGGCRLSTELHVCRTVCRRAERVLVALSRKEDVPADALGYVNRLSDALFVWSRWVCKELNVEETVWAPNEAASGGASD